MEEKPLEDWDNHPWYPKGSIHQRLGLEDNREWGNTLLPE